MDTNSYLVIISVKNKSSYFLLPLILLWYNHLCVKWETIPIQAWEGMYYASHLLKGRPGFSERCPGCEAQVTSRGKARLS